MPKKYITKKNRKGLKIKNKSKSRSRKIQKRVKRKSKRRSRKKQRGGMENLSKQDFDYKAERIIIPFEEVYYSNMNHILGFGGKQEPSLSLENANNFLKQSKLLLELGKFVKINDFQKKFQDYILIIKLYLEYFINNIRLETKSSNILQYDDEITNEIIEYIFKAYQYCKRYISLHKIIAYYLIKNNKYEKYRQLEFYSENFLDQFKETEDEYYIISIVIKINDYINHYIDYNNLLLENEYHILDNLNNQIKEKNFSFMNDELKEIYLEYKKFQEGIRAYKIKSEYEIKIESFIFSFKEYLLQRITLQDLLKEMRYLKILNNNYQWHFLDNNLGLMYFYLVEFFERNNSLEEYYENILNFLEKFYTLFKEINDILLEFIKNNNEITNSFISYLNRQLYQVEETKTEYEELKIDIIPGIKWLFEDEQSETFYTSIKTIGQKHIELRKLKKKQPTGWFRFKPAYSAPRILKSDTKKINEYLTEINEEYEKINTFIKEKQQEYAKANKAKLAARLAEQALEADRLTEEKLAKLDADQQQRNN